MDKSFMMIVGMLTLTIWGISLYYRCSDEVIRRRLVIIVCLLIFWLLDVLVRYKTDTYLVSTITWYLYYIPILFVPALCVTLAFKAATLERKPFVRVGEKAIFALCGLLALLVLFNNKHNLAFVFDRPYPVFFNHYSYGPVYWICTFFVAASFIAFIVILGYSCRKRLRRGLIPLGILLLASVVFGIMYVMRVDFVFSANFSFFYIVMISLALELCLDFGLLPSCIWYKDIFYRLPMDVMILSRSGDSVYTTSQNELGNNVQSAIRERIRSRPKEIVFTDPDNPNSNLHLRSLTGGYVLLAEDMTVLNKERRRLEKIHEALTCQTIMLQHERDIDAELRQAEQERKLLGDIDASLRETVTKIDSLLQNALVAKGEAHGEERKRLLTLVRILVAYCKRKGSLVLSQSGGEDFNAERLRVILNEAAGDLRSIGIECAALVDVTSQIPAPAMNALYDCFYDFIVSAFFCENPTIMLFLSDENDSHIELRALLECDSTDGAFWSTWEKDLTAMLDQRNLMYTLGVKDGEAKLVIRVAVGGNELL